MGIIIKQLFEFLSIELTVIMIATLPVIELRGAIPVGISLGLSPLHAFVLSFIGSIIPIPFILFTIRPIFNYLKETKLFNKLINSITDKSINNSDRVKKYGALGLVLISAIPLPGTGVWGGSLIGALLGIRFKWAFPAIVIGNLIAGIFIMMLSSGVIEVIGG